MKRRKKRKRKEKELEKEKQKEEEEEKEEDEEKEKVAFKKNACLSSLGFSDHLRKRSSIVNLGNKTTKANWTLSWSSAFEICGNTVL